MEINDLTKSERKLLAQADSARPAMRPFLLILIAVLGGIASIFAIIDAFADSGPNRIVDLSKLAFALLLVSFYVAQIGLLIERRTVISLLRKLRGRSDRDDLPA